jgi:hypothetical protein
MKENWVGGACGTHGRGEEIVQVFGTEAEVKRTFEEGGRVQNGS